MLSFDRYDKYGQVLHPGDVCARAAKGGVELVVYKKHSWGTKRSKSEFGRFITPNGERSVKYSSVAFVFNPMGDRRARAEQLTKLVREFYEGRQT